MTSEEKRNHALKSLERRFELAKTGTIQRKDRESPMTPKVNSYPHTPSSKGSKMSFSSKKKANDENEWTYARLSHQTDEKLLLPTDATAENKEEPVTQKILHDLLQHGDHSRKYIQGGKSRKIDNWILLDTLVKKPSSSSSCARALEAHSNRSKKCMSMRQLKKLGILHLPPDLQRYDVFLPMHEKWKEYMSKLVKISGKDKLSQSFLNADLHGALIYVADCKNGNLIGVCGIMIRETAETMGIITKDDKFKVVPKKLSVFIFQFGCWKVTLYGDKLISRILSL